LIYCCLQAEEWDIEAIEREKEEEEFRALSEGELLAANLSMQEMTSMKAWFAKVEAVVDFMMMVMMMMMMMMMMMLMMMMMMMVMMMMMSDYDDDDDDDGDVYHK
jgi:heme/copper-type cytochrome/quinol oxidase subunit 2